MSIEDTKTAKPCPSNDQNRRKFLKTALTGTFAAPVVTSLAMDHLVNQARAQQAYVPPTVVSYTRTSPNLTTGASTSATYEVLFSQPIDTSSTQCWTLQICSATGCNVGDVFVLYLGFANPPTIAWSNGNQTMTISNLDETGGGTIAVGHAGSTRFEASPTGASCPSSLLGANGLAVVNSSHCVSYESLG